GCVRPQIGPKELANLRPGQLSQVLSQLLLGVAPGKVVVRLGEAQLGQPVHHFWACESFGEKNSLGIIALDLADQPFPEWERLGMRVVDSKDSHALVDPIQDYALELLPERLPVLGLEIERVDILIFLGRVLGVLDGAVRPRAEPAWMLFNIGMIG